MRQKSMFSPVLWKACQCNALKKQFELLDRPGKPIPFTLTSKDAIELLEIAVHHGAKLGMEWESTPITLTPSDDLIALVQKSQQYAATNAEEE